MNKMHFTFSDLISGYISAYDWDKKTFTIKTTDERLFEVYVTDTTGAEMIRVLGEGYIDCTGNMMDMLDDIGRFVYAYGIFFNEGGDFKFEAKRIVFVGKEADSYDFEQQDWWVRQIDQLAQFYKKAQFDNGEIDFAKYRTHLTLEGTKLETTRQETDTISRMVYGFATAFMMTGDDSYLEVAEKGTKYLRDHFRCVDQEENTAYWYHAVDFLGNNKYKKIIASQFGDDYDALPAYEQIYALAGPAQTYRATGDPLILKDMQMTVDFMEKYYLDKQNGGYWSHIDPVTFKGDAEMLGRDKARKNWNSCGDHTPAYLINLYLATNDERYKNMLKYTADLIVDHFQDYENSPFVEEKFHADWTKDKTWGWQQNRAVVGHNLKIAWNLMRVQSAIPDPEFVKMSEKIADLMPQYGMDQQRTGWYDVVDRVRKEGEEFNHFAWHDRKAWWQQEQGILAYYILSGVLKQPQYLKLARESAAFYSAWFQDHDSGGVYFNVMANGIPYLLGTERLKASHSMSCYHAFELAYLCAVYINLLVTKEFLDLYFSPYPNSLKDNKLYVAPDILPKGSIKIEKVWIGEEEYTDFDAENLIVNLPKTDKRIKFKVRIIPIVGFEDFSICKREENDTIELTLKGELTDEHVELFQRKLENVKNSNPKIFKLNLSGMKTICPAGIRAIIFNSQHIQSKIIIAGANDLVKKSLDNDEFSEMVEFV